MKQILLSCLLVLIALACAAQTPIEVEPVKELKPTGSLGTCGYTPLPTEKPFYEKLGEKDKAMEAWRKAAEVRGHNPPAAFAKPFARKKLGA